MADEETVTEKPRKAKRTKAGKKPAEDIPLTTMDVSGSKFNQLLQQAVDQTLSEAKSEKKKKKKKGEDTVLESLKKGEGLEKEVDETKLANTFDPDDTKYEKSNKKKQKLLDDKNRQNELEIIDETKGKTKKKKKPKLQDELIENVEESQLETVDKTMTLSELDASVAKTPGKKKKKKQEEEPVTSARSEDEPSVMETPKKRPRKKPTGTVEEPMSGEATSETVPTPTKRKKKKVPAGGESEDGALSPEEDTVMSPKGKKKKKRTDGGMDEEAALSPAEDFTSPRGKKKKKKTEGERDEEGAVSPSEEPISPKGKKGKKKKGGETEDEALSPSEEPSTSTDGKKKKKKKKEKETEEDELLSGEEVESPRTKDKKKKKKGKDAEEQEEPEEKTEEEETTKKKDKKKKKKKGEEEIEAVEEEPAGMDVEDEGRILAVTIHRTDKLKNDFFIMHPMVRVHVFDEMNGKYLPKQHKDRAVTAFYETKNEKVTHVLPIMTRPFDFKQNKSVLPVWEELLVFNENYNYFVQDKPKVIIVFELVDSVSMNRASRNDDGFHRIAWAFLKVVGNNNKINTGSKVRLQLFEAPQSNIRGKNQKEEEQFLWWKSAPKKPYPSTLYVTLKGITPPREVEPAERSLFATQEEKGRMTYEDLKKSVNWTGKKVPKQRTLSSWSRIPGQLCRLPNSLCLALPTAKKGCFVIRFSHDGRSIACACQGKEGFPILVYEIPSGRLKGKFLGHFGIVYDLSWSKMDTHLLSASSDGTARVWDLQDFGEQQQKLLPHPAFVYCSQFHSRVDTIAVTGSYDQVIRVWDVGDDSKVDLRQELESHQGFVNSICFAEDGQKMYSADSAGVIIIWNSFFTEIPSKRGIARDWTIYKKIEDPEMVGTAINCIQLHPRERRLLVHTRDNIIRMFDLRIERVMQKYIGALNFREQIRSAITPCGSFVFSGSEDNFSYAWNTDTGDQVIMYSELNYQNPVTDVHYHPRDHMVAFCSLGENHPVLIYDYDVATAQFEAGLSPRQISPAPAGEEGMLGTAKLQDELNSKGVLTKEEFELHTTQRYDKVMKTLNKVTAQMTSTPMLDLPGMTIASPRSTMMTMGSTTYDMYGTPRSMTGSPTMFSPHAQKSMGSTARHQQFTSQNLYMKGVDSWRPTFSEVGRHGRSTSPVFGRTPQLNMTASQQGKAQFNFQEAPGKGGQKKEKVVALYDYKAQRSDELDIYAGDEIVVLFKDNENWWMGELQDGQQGFFPSNYVTSEDLMESHRTAGTLTPDDSDTDKKEKMTAVRTKSGELKFVSGEEDSEDDLLKSGRTRRRRKRNSQDSGGSLSGASQTSGTTSGKPPRKTGQKVRINESQNNESNA